MWRTARGWSVSCSTSHLYSPPSWTPTPVMVRSVPTSSILGSLLTLIPPAVRTRWPFFQSITVPALPCPSLSWLTGQSSCRVEPTSTWEQAGRFSLRERERESSYLDDSALTNNPVLPVIIYKQLTVISSTSRQGYRGYKKNSNLRTVFIINSLICKDISQAMICCVPWGRVRLENMKCPALCPAWISEYQIFSVILQNASFYQARGGTAPGHVPQNCQG